MAAGARTGAGLAGLGTREGFCHPIPKQPPGAPAPLAQPCWVLPAPPGCSFPLPSLGIAKLLLLLCLHECQ